MKPEIIEQIEGYTEIKKDLEVARKYGPDPDIYKGEVLEYVNRLHPSKISLKVTDIREETPSTKTLRLSAAHRHLPPFQAGQYITLYVTIDGIRTSRAYSISSPPNQAGYYDITVRRVEDGLVSNYLLDRVSVGDMIESSGPEGTFHFNPIIHDTDMVCLAGGSGITPFYSMIREVVEAGLDRKITLFYGSKNTDDIIFHDELSRIAERFDSINYIPVIEEPSSGYSGATGFISADLIKKEAGNVREKSFFICGPQNMYNFCLPELENLGISRRKIRKEMFGSPINIWEYPGWPQEVDKEKTFSVSVNNSTSFEAKASESLLSAMEKNGVIVPSLCRSGECSMCRVKLAKGTVFQPQGTPVRESDRRFGYIHTCVSYPLEALEIII
ncbi:MAG: 2Fe-2S iron-sulfur cluster binding domain-containing protein [bacterium]|nr:2Fe-2S iron-sulfur cluster binding domain-containing protein [bacterium]